MSAIDNAATAMAVASCIRARREALLQMVVACLDELAQTDAQGDRVETCRDRSDAFSNAVTLATFVWEYETGIVVAAKL